MKKTLSETTKKEQKYDRFIFQRNVPRLKFSKKEPIWQISSIKENLFPPQTPSQPGLPFRSWRSGSKRLSKRKKRRNLSKPPQIILHDITAILCGDSLL